MIEKTIEAPELQQRQALLELLCAYRQSRILITCAELGVFEALAEEGGTGVELGERLGADERGLELLLNAAVALGLLEKRDGRYANTQAARACLVGSGPYAIGNFVRREGAFYLRWGNLTPAVRSGRRPEENTHDEEPEAWVRGFEYALYDLSRAVAPLIAEALALPEDRELHLLDVGGGHGGYSIALAQRYPKLKATVLELPRVVPVAREIIAQAGLSDRVAVQEGDFRHDDLGHGYDLALLFGVMVGEPPQGRAELIAKVSAALKPGGQLALREFLLNPDRTSPPEAALFALQMLLSTGAGGVSTTEEMDAWLREAGFAPPHPLDLPACAGTVLVCRKKPS